MNMKAQVTLGLAAVVGFSVAASADVIMDQILDPSNYSGNTYASQWFESGYEAYTVAAIDNFFMPYDGTITSIEAVVSGWNGYGGMGGITGWTVAIYASPEAAGTDLLTGALVYQQQATYDYAEVGWGGSLIDLVQFNTEFMLEAGEYWVGVIPENPFGSNGQTGITGALAGDPGDLNAHQANPGQGFGMGASWQIDPPNNLAYRINAIPAPGALALLGLAGLVSRRRR
jgi:hypothetical protein